VLVLFSAGLLWRGDLASDGSRTAFASARHAEGPADASGGGNGFLVLVALSSLVSKSGSALRAATSPLGLARLWRMAAIWRRVSP
jgi:hypothetical protein